MTPDDRRRVWVEREIKEKSVQMAERGMFVRDDFGNADWLAVGELTDFLAVLLDAPLGEMEEALSGAEGNLLYAAPMRCVDCLDVYYGPKCGCLPTCQSRIDNHEAALGLIRTALARLPWREEGKRGT